MRPPQTAAEVRKGLPPDLALARLASTRLRGAPDASLGHHFAGRKGAGPPRVRPGPPAQATNPATQPPSGLARPLQVPAACVGTAIKGSMMPYIVVRKLGRLSHTEGPDMKRIRIQRVSVASTVLTIVLAIACVVTFVFGYHQFNNLKDASQAYMECEDASDALLRAADYLAEQTRLAVITSDVAYAENYDNEVNVTQRRESAIATLKTRFDGTDAFNSLEAAIKRSYALEDTELRAMRLSLESAGSDPATWPECVREFELTEAESALSAQDKYNRAIALITTDQYEGVYEEISDSVERCSSSLITQTENAQNHATDVFKDVYSKSEVIVAVFAVMTLASCAVMRHLIVNPLISYNESIQRGEIFPVIGAEELQSLARTYNRVYQENEDNLLLIRHQAEHDGLTNLLNRRSFDRMLELFDDGSHDFALILADVDTFKQVNDTYGHATGDKILQKVSNLLSTTYRSIDHVCRTGGDEFAIIMVEMTSDLAYTIEEKTQAINEQLMNPTDGLPPVSLSVGVAFADREGAAADIYKDADAALYHTKEHGRNGCSVFGSF